MFLRNLFLKFLHQVYFNMIIDGKKVAAELREELKKKVTELKSKLIMLFQD